LKGKDKFFFIGWEISISKIVSIPCFIIVCIIAYLVTHNKCSNVRYHRIHDLMSIIFCMNDLTANHQFRQGLIDNLSKLIICEITDHDKKHAAVAVVVTNCDRPADIAFDENACDQAAFVLTTRSSKLNNHRVQRTFPGGRIDAGETAEEAALRELEE
jgi:hypothetical protein